jgi:hypothetical protein
VFPEFRKKCSRESSTFPSGYFTKCAVLLLLNQQTPMWSLPMRTPPVRSPSLQSIDIPRRTYCQMQQCHSQCKVGQMRRTRFHLKFQCSVPVLHVPTLGLVVWPYRASWLRHRCQSASKIWQYCALLRCIALVSGLVVNEKLLGLKSSPVLGEQSGKNYPMYA